MKTVIHPVTIETKHLVYNSTFYFTAMKNEHEMRNWTLDLGFTPLINNDSKPFAISNIQGIIRTI